DGSFGALVALCCETDFVSRMPEFKELANNLAIHVGARKTLYKSREDIPANKLETEIYLAREEFKAKGMPEEKISKILPGKLEKFYEQVSLPDQYFVLNEEIKIKDVILEFSS